MKGRIEYEPVPPPPMKVVLDLNRREWNDLRHIMSSIVHSPSYLGEYTAHSTEPMPEHASGCKTYSLRLLARQILEVQ